MYKNDSSTVNIFSDMRRVPPSRGLRSRLLWSAANAFSALMRFAFQLLYYPLSFTYDTVAWIVSAGEWADWRRCVLPYLRPGRVLELAHGTGTLALDMADRGYSVAAVDLSPAMGRIASSKKRNRTVRRTRSGLASADPAFIRADVRELPFPEVFFSSAVSTFPADFIFSPATVAEVHRTLRPGGIWIILPAAYPEWIAGRLLRENTDSASRNLFSLFARHVEAAGFSVRTEIIRRPHSRVMLILAEK
jgi:SAM-dependent methyltransferase